MVFVRSTTPIFTATNTNNVLVKNIQPSHDTQLFDQLLRRHAALESVEAMVTIHGNPFLMSQLNRRPSDTQRQGNIIDDDNAEQNTDAERVMQNWENIPALAKINIKMPISSDTPSSRDSFALEPFWYDGYYYIYGIDHKFQGGQFTQDLHLLALPNESLLDKKNETDITECGAQGGPLVDERGIPTERIQKGIDEALARVGVPFASFAGTSFRKAVTPKIDSNGQVTPSAEPPVPTATEVAEAAGAVRS